MLLQVTTASTVHEYDVCMFSCLRVCVCVCDIGVL